MDLTVGATPGYFATMAVERRLLQRRAAEHGPSPADYERRDTVASLTMGTASLLVPIVLSGTLRKVLVPEGRVRRGVLAATGTAVALTTIADALGRRMVEEEEDGTDGHGDGPAEERPHTASRRIRRLLRRASRGVSQVGGVASVALGGATVTTLWARLTGDDQMWGRRFVRDLGNGPLMLLGAVLGWDFIYYWNHRFMHESRFMWAVHVVHHSSERYNLSTALRQPVADALGTFLPNGLMALVGIRPELIGAARGINLLYQYWIHTETIGKLGPFERLFNTPSHHRVHHGSNPQYIDRNHGSILIVWDRLFGTFEPEGDRVVYGLTKNINTFNPLRIATHEYVDILRDVAVSTTWRERLSYVVRGPGWAYRRHAERHLVRSAEEDTGVPHGEIGTAGGAAPSVDGGGRAAALAPAS